jgi:hypothetical protein
MTGIAIANPCRKSPFQNLDGDGCERLAMLTKFTHINKLK